MTSEAPTTKPFGKLLRWLPAIFVALILLGVALGPTSSGHLHGLAAGSAAMQKSRQILTALQDYADKHEGLYPSGNSSTSIFQQLLDQGYVDDSSVFCADQFPGKTPAKTKKLECENVSYDVTAGVDSSSPDDLPIVFLTGRRIDYSAGTATLLPHSDLPWWMVVSYKSNNNFVVMPSEAPRVDSPGLLPNGLIPNFVLHGTKLNASKYRQLTPDGPLSP